MSDSAQAKVSREDLESKFRQFQGEVTEVANRGKGYAVYAGIGVGIVVLILAFLLGSRRGKKKTTVVEIRRI